MYLFSSLNGTIPLFLVCPWLHNANPFPMFGLPSLAWRVRLQCKSAANELSTLMDKLTPAELWRAHIAIIGAVAQGSFTGADPLVKIC